MNSSVAKTMSHLNWQQAMLQMDLIVRSRPNEIKSLIKLITLKGMRD